ncbi:hypothetical protein BGX26_012399 [Mortierella sp. AD094]|nr:hypothetical protein BGX26_012399 [Mortierella sp. AD094]
MLCIIAQKQDRQCWTISCTSKKKGKVSVEAKFEAKAATQIKDSRKPRKAPKETQILTKQQANESVAEFLAPIITSVFKQLGILTLTGEIPVAVVADPRLEKMECAHYADIVITTKTGEQVCILESSLIDEDCSDSNRLATAWVG